MRAWLLLIAALVPFVTEAREVDFVAQWSACQQDDECVVIMGKCAPAAVNEIYKDVAAEHFKVRAQGVTCTKQFWQPTMEGAGAHCRLQRCEVVGKAKTK